MRHKWADLIHAWAEGEEIEMAPCNWSENPVGKWRLVPNPNWDDSCYVYRIKPTPKPDVVYYASLRIEGDCCAFMSRNPMVESNLKITFDGETGKIKSAEVLK